MIALVPLVFYGCLRISPYGPEILIIFELFRQNSNYLKFTVILVLWLSFLKFKMHFRLFQIVVQKISNCKQPIYLKFGLNLLYISPYDGKRQNVYFGMEFIIHLPHGHFFRFLFVLHVH